MAAVLALLGKAGAEYGLDAVGDAIKSFSAGKTGETIGGYNEGKAKDLRTDARERNVDVDDYERRASGSSNRAAESGQRRTMADTAFGNQLDQSNKRAELVNRMALNDQNIAADQATQLANNYNSAMRDQANTSANLMASILNRRAAY
jgi:hypothetical protein